MRKKYVRGDGGLTWYFYIKNTDENHKKYVRREGSTHNCVMREGGPIEKYKMGEGGSEKVFPTPHILLNGIALSIYLCCTLSFNKYTIERGFSFKSDHTKDERANKKNCKYTVYNNCSFYRQHILELSSSKSGSSTLGTFSAVNSLKEIKTLLAHQIS